MPANERRFWWCGGRNGIGHVVGELIIVEASGMRLTALYQYEESVATPPENVPPARNEQIMGTVRKMHCTLCDRTYDWYAGAAAWEAMMRGRS